MAETARFLADYRKAVGAHSLLIEAGSPDFLNSQLDLNDNASHSSIWQQAIEKKREFLRNQSQTSTDKIDLIRS